MQEGVPPRRGGTPSWGGAGFTPVRRGPVRRWRLPHGPISGSAVVRLPVVPAPTARRWVPDSAVVLRVVVVRGVVVAHLLVRWLWPWWQKITSLRVVTRSRGQGAITSQLGNGDDFASSWVIRVGVGVRRRWCGAWRTGNRAGGGVRQCAHGGASVHAGCAPGVLARHGGLPHPATPRRCATWWVEGGLYSGRPPG